LKSPVDNPRKYKIGDLRHLRRSSHIARKNLTAEALTLTIGVDALVIDPWRADLQRAAPRHELPRRRFPVSHDLRPAACISRLTMARDVLLDFRRERFLQHLQRAALQHLVQRGP
jgi:hypothetical protein